MTILYYICTSGFTAFIIGVASTFVLSGSIFLVQKLASKI